MYIPAVITMRMGTPMGNRDLTRIYRNTITPICTTGGTRTPMGITITPAWLKSNH